MCGIVGVYGHDYVAQDVYDGLITLQHRGQDAAGIGTFNGKFHSRKDYGLVKDVFRTRHMKRLRGHVGIGHTRYATIGMGDIEEVQPFLGSAPFGVLLAHNGNLFNSHELKEEIFKKDHRLVNSDSDGEVILNLFTKALTKQNPDKIEADHVAKAVESVHKRAKGAYSVIGYIAKQGFFAFKDPYGIRPMVFGKRDNGIKTDYIFASESVTLDILGFEYVDDVKAGELIFIDEETRTVHRKVLSKKEATPCVFEYVYFARPDSIISGISVYKSRMRMGTKLAEKIAAAKLDIDVVMPVPDSSRSAALQIGQELGLRYREGLVKNRYIGRTFIMPGQKIRKKSIRYKLNPMPLEIKGKKVLLIDDSIVRGNTSRKIVELVRSAGAEKVYFASYSPPVISPNLYGIDIPTKDELIAARLDNDEIRQFMNADELFYGEVDDMLEACIEGNPEIKDLDMSCFDGVYKTGDIDDKVLEEQAQSRSGERGVKKCGSLDKDDFDDSEVDAKQLNLL
jgi:amidophosphoribosyltransferase